MINLSRTLAITRKEVYHVLRDPFTLALSIGLPVFMVFTFGYVIEFNTKNLNIAIHDEDHTQSSRRLVETMGSSQYFLPSYEATADLAQQAIGAERVHAAMIIPPKFQDHLLSQKAAKVQVLLDGSDNSIVGPVLNYLGLVQNLASKRLTNSEVPQIMQVQTRFLFNHELNSRWFVIPGLAVVVMTILSILLTALTVAKEWENGSMELLLSTPVRPLEIIIGKLTPYGVMAVIAVFFVYVVSRTVFNIPFRGSLLVFMLGGIVFLATYLAQGLLISVTTRKQQLAMQISMMSGMIPSQLLSGFIFPIESMPTFFHYLTMLFPARWYMEIARNSYLKGSMFSEMLIPFSALGILCVLMMTMATRRFKRDLEP